MMELDYCKFIYNEMEGKPTDSIYVRVIKNEEVQPKVKKIN